VREGEHKSKGLHGLLVVDKPVGWSSMDVVRRVRRAAGGVKCGHAGTLDPLATGVVVCCLGRATRCVPEVMRLRKVYEAQVDLSAFTATDDLEGQRVEVEVASPPGRKAVEAALQRFVGEVEQTPPAFSAVHVDGRRAYELARKGREVTLAPRKVRIDRIELLGYRWPMAVVRVVCGKGTYIRSLARDLGRALGTGGHVAGLRRLAVGGYDLSMAVDAQRLAMPLTEEDLIPLPVKK
jgi:tRNA pseudouridine55 synthase